MSGDVARLIRDRAAGLALRAAAVAVMPALAAWLAWRLGYFPFIPDVLAFDALQGRGVPWQGLLVAAVVGVLALLAALSRDRAASLLTGLATGLVVWLGFPFSELRWYRFVPQLQHLARLDRVEAGMWAGAAGLLLAAAAYAVVEAARRTRRAYAEKGVPDATAAAAGAAVARGGALALAAGAAGAATLAAAFFALSDGVRAAGEGLPRVNPVIAFLAGGVLLAATLGLVLRGRDVASGDLPPLLAAHAPETRPAADGEGSQVPVDVQNARAARFHAWVGHEIARERQTQQEEREQERGRL